ncbi:hypothetical protein C8J56DRAFT_353071 [Mycena floridula]|nr:hypothetical protein C8J56DRAFT_353071 [Mycena floridula]
MMHSVLILAMAALPATMATDFAVTVGAGGNLAFNPETVQAMAGDTVTFTFFPNNHSVSQSSFDSPCVASGQFQSGFVPTGSVGKTYTINVNDASVPVWFHCEQTNPKSHCAAGMVFAINPPADGSPNSFAAFKAKAMGVSAPTSETATTPTTTMTEIASESWALATATVTSGASTWLSTYTSYIGSAAPTYAPSPVDHRIIVGANSLFTFEPSNISASLGDTVTFEFHAKAHSATRSSFGKPCVPIDQSTLQPGDFFDTGLTPVDLNATIFPTYTFVVNGTAPIWVYCKQTNPFSHCGRGMVFSVNSVETSPNTFAAFQALAIAQNGTTSTNATGTGPAPSQTGTNNNGAARTHATGLALVLVIVAACFL